MFHCDVRNAERRHTANDRADGQRDRGRHQPENTPHNYEDSNNNPCTRPYDGKIALL